MWIIAIALSLGNYSPPLDPVRANGTDAGLVVTTPYMGLGNGNCGVYPYTYYDASCAHPAWDLGSVYGGFHIAGEPVFAAAGGTIAALDPDGYCGIDVFVDHGDGVFTRYCHLSAYAGDLYVGMPIGERHVIGFVGSTGASAPHLHFEARSGIYGAYIDLGDPLQFAGGGGGGGCGDLDYTGRCDGAVLVWCEGNTVHSFDCAQTGQACGYQDDAVGYNCVAAPPPDPCSGVDYAGRCDGDVLVWCENETLRTFDCASNGEVCAYQDDAIGNNCLPPPPPPPEPPPAEPPPQDQPPDEPPPDEPVPPEEPAAAPADPDDIGAETPGVDEDPGVPIDRDDARVVIAPSPASCAQGGGPALLVLAALARRRGRG
jgi:hypothetical protein